MQLIPNRRVYWFLKFQWLPTGTDVDRGASSTLKLTKGYYPPLSHVAICVLVLRNFAWNESDLTSHVQYDEFRIIWKSCPKDSEILLFNSDILAIFVTVNDRWQFQTEQNNTTIATATKQSQFCPLVSELMCNFLVDPVYFYGICKLDSLINA